MKRGDIVTVAIPGDWGKPRPAVVIQSDLFNETHSSILTCPLTSELHHDAVLFRIPVAPSQRNGLVTPSEIMVDKVTPLRREKIGKWIGTLEDDALWQLNQNLALFLGLVP